MINFNFRPFSIILLLAKIILSESLIKMILLVWKLSKFVKLRTLKIKICNIFFHNIQPPQRHKKIRTATCIFAFLLIATNPLGAQHSVARQWNDVLLEAIRGDFARPTVHARNLFHVSIAMYDAWAAYDEIAQPYMLGKVIGNFRLPYEKPLAPENIQAAQEEAISFAVFRIITERFRFSPGAFESLFRCDSLLNVLGYDATFTSTDYASGIPAALGNYIAEGILAYGDQDSSNEANDYANLYYRPLNASLDPDKPGNPNITNPNHWQPLSLSVFIDQSGNPIPGQALPFLSPEWGNLPPFAMTEEDKSVYQRNGETYTVYHDPGPPALINPNQGGGDSEEYKWGFSLVAIWSSHLDPKDSVMWDISPASIGNIQSYPTNIEGLRDFYDLIEGGDIGQGYDLNPHTGQAYEAQYVYRADYARVLAEFWADGPNSETPPGHWFTILNHVNDHPLLEKRFKGQGPVLDDLEWDIKAYFSMSGALHDAAISAWSIKGYYDYIRPVSAIRWMADQGQSSDSSLLSYHPDGIPLVPDLIDVVLPGDPLAGSNDEHVGKIKLYAWRGPDYIVEPKTDYAGVGWILAENWWPYQRPTFVTPPFAGYISGHSTFSRAAAEVLTLLTGDPFFPGGMGEFVAEKNEFLVFEEGPSETLTLQWATYRDASDQTSLSRIWGGIHPPVDDIPGRLIGIELGTKAFEMAEGYFLGEIVGEIAFLRPTVYPNPANIGTDLTVFVPGRTETAQVELLNLAGQKVYESIHEIKGSQVNLTIPTQGLAPAYYSLRVIGDNWTALLKVIIQ